MKLPSLLTIAATSLLLGGCVGYMPPLSNKPHSGKSFAGRDVDFITIGKTTRAEVVKKLGTGYRDSIRVNAIAYPCEVSGGSWFMIPVGFGPMENSDQAIHRREVTLWRAIFIMFDARGVVIYASIVLYRSDIFVWDITRKGMRDQGPDDEAMARRAGGSRTKSEISKKAGK